MSVGATPIEFELGGEVYPVAFTVNALCSLEDEFGGASIAKVGEMIASGSAGIRGARALFRAALLDGRPDTTPAEAGKLMVELGPDATGDLVQRAFDELKAGLEREVVKLPSPDARGRLSFQAGGRRLTLAFDINAQAEMEAYFEGLRPEAILARVHADGGSLSDLRALFRAALTSDADLTHEEAGKVMDRIGIKLAGEAVKAAFAGSFPVKEPANREERRGADAAARRHPTKSPPKASGTGKRSTRSGARKR